MIHLLTDEVSRFGACGKELNDVQLANATYARSSSNCAECLNAKPAESHPRHRPLADLLAEVDEIEQTCLAQIRFYGETLTRVTSLRQRLLAEPGNPPGAAAPPNAVQPVSR